MSNISYCVCTNFFGDFYKLCVVKFTTVGRKTSENNFGFVLECHLAQVLVIDFARIYILHLVTDKVEDFIDSGGRVPVRQVSTVTKIHSEYSIARLH